MRLAISSTFSLLNRGTLSGMATGSAFKSDAGIFFFGDEIGTGVEPGSQGANLFHVMQSVHEVKLAPLVDGKRAQDGMVENPGARSKAGSATAHHFIHF